MSPKPFILAILLLVGLALPSAQAAEEDRVEVWDTPRDVFIHMVQNDTTLIIRGVPVTLEAGLVVAPRGRLVLEPGPEGSPATLRAAGPDGWSLLVQGEMVVDSRGGAPAILEGMGGEATPNRDTILLSGGLTVAGRLDADGLVVRNHTGAFSLAPNATLRMRNVTFSSGTGLSIVATNGDAIVEDARFEGAGGGVWVAADGTLRIARSTFQDVPVAVTQLGKSATLEDITVHNASTTCVRAAKGHLVVRGLACDGFTKSGVEITRPTQGLGRPTGDVAGLRATSTNASAPAVYVDGADALELSDSVLGPVGGSGVESRGVQPTLRNVTFRDVASYNVLLLDLGAPPRVEGLAEGAPGGLGHVYVGARFFLRALDADGAPAARAEILVLLEPDDVRVARLVLPPSGQSDPFVLDVYKVGRDGVARNFSYHIRAHDGDGTHAWERRGYVPEGDPLLFQIVDARAVKASTPGLPFAGALLALACAAMACGRPRSPP